jgi:hypothetical protein
MSDEFDQLRDFLAERGVRFLGLAPEVAPPAKSAWRYVVRASVPVTERIPGDDIVRLDTAFQRLSERLSLLDRMPVLLAISNFNCPWARVEVLERDSLVQRLSVVPDEPCFILAPESGKFILGVDTEEWEYQLIAARWSDEGTFVPWLAT